MHTSITLGGSAVSSAGMARLVESIKSVAKTGFSCMTCTELARLVSPERG